MSRRKKTVLAAAALLALAAAAFIYTRPLTIEQRYPFLDLSQCTQIRGYYYDGEGVAPVSFTIRPDDAHFEELLSMFRSAALKTRLRNILPSSGVKTHRSEEGDFQWEVMLRLEDVLFPSGDTGGGDMLHLVNFYGDLSLRFDGETVECAVSNQEQWLKEVLEIIRQYPDETDLGGGS